MAIEVGQTARRSLTLKQAHLRTFVELTGDNNPLHGDADFASARCSTRPSWAASRLVDA
jgi:acyl dehydratase